MSHPFCYLTKKARTSNDSISGKGTFAVENIHKGEVIAAFGGQVVNQQGYDLLPEGLGELYLTIDDDLFIGPPSFKDTGDGDFVNHSCNPNAGILGQIKLVAMQEIKVGEEITFDYAMVLSDTAFKIECQCNQKECRKFITGQDWKNPALQSKYQGFFSEYLAKQIKA